jgi:hypothetical protein
VSEVLRECSGAPGWTTCWEGGAGVHGSLILLAGLILLAACANLGSLFAARTADRAKDTALRLALGSRRGLILRQMITETALVSLAGGAVGLPAPQIRTRSVSIPVRRFDRAGAFSTLDGMKHFVEKHSAKAGKWLGRRIDTAANSFHESPRTKHSLAI